MGTAFAQDPPRVLPPRPLPPTEGLTTKFDLDFKGGGPRELVAAIQKASGNPVNVIISDDLGDVKLPALKMKNVDVPQLFRALESSSQKNELVKAGGNYQQISSRYGFRANVNTASDDTIWYFYVEKQNPPPSNRVVQFYSLASYLESGLTVDDITTAIKTGAKMLGEGAEPAISFHKDTKLLIAVGEPAKLEIISAVLRALGPPRPAVPSHPAPQKAP